MVSPLRPPALTCELVGNPQALVLARKWADSWKKGKSQKPLLVYGPTGTGKTALAHAIASEYGWELYELNASGLRDADTMGKTLSAAVGSSSIFGTKRLILIDDVDAISGKTERGSASTIAKALSSSKQPVILTSHSYYAKNLQAIKQLCMPLEFRKVHAASIGALIKKKAGELSIQLPGGSAEKMAKSASGDVRAALNDLQAHNISAVRDKEKGIFDTVRTILKSTSFSEARIAVFSSGTDRASLKTWVAHNLPAEYTRPFDLAQGYEAISTADIFESRASRTQCWGLFRYANDLLSSGVALAKTGPYHKYTPLSYPEYIRKMGASKSARAVRKTVLRKVSKFCHCSTSQAQSYLPLLQYAAKKDAHQVSRLFGFDENELLFVSKAKKAKPGKKKN